MAFGEEQESVKFKNAECIRETARALLVRFDGRERWIPKSAVHDDSEVYGNLKDNSKGTLVIVGWWWAEHEDD